MDLGGRGDPAPVSPDQIASDTKLVERFRALGFNGLGYDLFIERHARYGLAVVGAWIKSGTIFRHCHDHNRQVKLRPPASWSPEDRDDLAVSTVAVAIRRFDLEGLRQGRWSAQKGAALSTYLIGLCLDAFPNEFRSWYRARRRQLPTESLYSEDAGFPSADDPTHALLSKEELIEQLEKLTSQQRYALLLRECGYTTDEVATILNVTYGAAAAAVHRARRRLRDDEGGARA